MMKPREIIIANLEHRNPPRPGMNFASREFHDWLFPQSDQNNCFKNRVNDIICLSVGPSHKWQQKRWIEGNREFYDDEWGNVWVRMKDGCQTGEIHQPAIAEWGKLEQLVIPDYDDPRRYAEASQRFSENGDKFKIGAMPGWVFSTSRYLRKMETYLCDLIAWPEEVERLHSVIADLMMKIIAQFAKAGADGILFFEDLGTQSGLLMSPALWKKMFKGHYMRLIDAAHVQGLKVFMHSCGKNCELLDDLIETGVDCFQFDQPAVYDMAELARKLKSAKTALWAPIDIQHVLPTGERELIEREAEHMYELFQGFMIFKNYSDLAGIGVRPEWDNWGYEKVLELNSSKNLQKIS